MASKQKVAIFFLLFIFLQSNELSSIIETTLPAQGFETEFQGVLAKTIDGSLYAFDLLNGKELWSIKDGSESNKELPGEASETKLIKGVDGMLYLVLYDGNEIDIRVTMNKLCNSKRFLS